MLATRWPASFDSDDWWFEVKWDGYRAIVGGADGKIRARSRRGLDLIGPFPELASVEISDGVVVDAEVTAFDEDGHPSFSQLRRRTGFGGSGTGASVGVNLVVFDLLFRGVDVTDLPYEKRRGLLSELEPESPIVVPEPTETHGVSLFNAVKVAGIEGVVAKRLGSRYQPGRRLEEDRRSSSASGCCRWIPAGRRWAIQDLRIGAGRALRNKGVAVDRRRWLRFR